MHPLHVTLLMVALTALALGLWAYLEGRRTRNQARLLNERLARIQAGSSNYPRPHDPAAYYNHDEED